MHELPSSSHQEGAKERATKEEVYQELRNGYDHLQEWWQNLIQTLSLYIPIKEIAEANFESPNKNFAFQSGKPIFFTPLHVCLAKCPDCGDRIWYQVVAFSNIEGQKAVVEIFPRPDNYNLGIYIPVKKETPLHYPFYKLTCRTEDNMETLQTIEIRHNSIKPDRLLLRSLIDLSSDRQIITNVWQTAKDETFFPRPDPQHTKRRPYQEFLFSINPENDIRYRFQYINRRPVLKAWNEGDITDNKRYIANWLARRRSFLPHGLTFSLANGVRKAFSFSPVVLPPGIEDISAKHWGLFNEGVYGRIPSLLPHPA